MADWTSNCAAYVEIDSASIHLSLVSGWLYRLNSDALLDVSLFLTYYVIEASHRMQISSRGAT